MRTGWGFDAHRFTATGRVLVAGVEVASDRGVAATSDGDVVAHAVADALLGAAALGDLGTMFPSADSRYQGADSMALLAEVVGRVASAGFAATAVDVTVLAETVRVAPHREAIRASLAGVLGLPVDDVSCKATTTDGMGFLGRDEGIAAVAVVTIR
ncbi:MAG: 2-C-methyl-D-erythritol 2,4-cyclodiphosphate synthase [Acidimicrobiia bacterium]